MKVVLAAAISVLLVPVVTGGDHQLRHLGKPDCVKPNGLCKNSAECCVKRDEEYICCLVKKKSEPGQDPNTKTCTKEANCKDEDPE